MRANKVDAAQAHAGFFRVVDMDLILAAIVFGAILVLFTKEVFGL